MIGSFAQQFSAVRGVERVPDASRTDFQRLPNHVFSRGGFLSQCSVRLKHKGNGFVQVRAGFVERYALGIGPRQPPPDLTNPAQAKETWVGHLPDTDGQVLNAKCQMLSAKC